MTSPKSLLEETLEAWQEARFGLIDEFENIPEKHFDFKPTKEMRSVRELAVHILEVAMMMTGELTREDTDFKRVPWTKLLQTYAAEAYAAKSRKELLSLLETQFHEAAKRFRDVGELHLMQFIERFDGHPGSRFTWLQHGIAQEMYHRGQLTVYARLLDIEPALTKKIKGS